MTAIETIYNLVTAAALKAIIKGYTIGEKQHYIGEVIGSPSLDLGRKEADITCQIFSFIDKDHFGKKRFVIDTDTYKIKDSWLVA